MEFITDVPEPPVRPVSIVAWDKVFDFVVVSDVDPPFFATTRYLDILLFFDHATRHLEGVVLLCGLAKGGFHSSGTTPIFNLFAFPTIL